MTSNPILDFGIDKTSLGYVGHDLQRPECILAEPDGSLWSAATGKGIAPWMASITFGGPDLRTVYVGSLRGTRIPYSTCNPLPASR